MTTPAEITLLGLDPAIGLDGTESFWIVQGGTDKRTTIAALVGMINVLPTLPTLLPVVAGGTLDASVDAGGYSIQSTVVSALTINLPSAEDRANTFNTPLRIVDVGGVLFSNNATLVCDGSDTIFGLSDFIMDQNYMCVDLCPARDQNGNYIGYYIA